MVTRGWWPHPIEAVFDMSIYFSRSGVGFSHSKTPARIGTPKAPEILRFGSTDPPIRKPVEFRTGAPNIPNVSMEGNDGAV